MDIKKKSPNIFECISCSYVTSNKKDWNRHIITVKHLRLSNPNSNLPKTPLSYECKCSKVYKHKSSLSLHKKTCVGKKEVILDEKYASEPSEKELILLLLKDNKALQELVIEQSKSMMEICKNGTNSNNHNTTHSHNKTFNLQFFLNEECKDALNISEFVSSIKMDLEDLETNKKIC